MCDDFLDDSNTEHLAKYLKVQKLDDPSQLIRSECGVMDRLTMKIGKKYDRNTTVLQYGNSVLDACRMAKDDFVREFDVFDEKAKLEMTKNERDLEAELDKIGNTIKEVQKTHKTLAKKMENATDMAAGQDYMLFEVAKNAEKLEKLKSNIESVWKLVQ